MGRSADDENEYENEDSRDRLSKSNTRKSHVWGHLSPILKKLGRRNLGLKEVRPTNPLYEKFLSYRLYRFRNNSYKPPSRGTDKVREFMLRIEPRKREHLIRSKGSIRSLDFPTRLVDEADIQEIGKTQPFIASHSFSKGLALCQFEVGVEKTRVEEGRASYPWEAAQYLLRSYA